VLASRCGSFEGGSAASFALYSAKTRRLRSIGSLHEDMNTSSAFDPQSPQARAIYDFGIVSGVVFTLIFVIASIAIFGHPRS